MKKILFIFVVLGLSLILIGQFVLRSPSQKTNNKIKIIATLFPLYDFAKIIGGDKVDVTLLLPPGVEAHSYEPKPTDIAKISQADIFIYTDKFMEPWAEDILKGVDSKKLEVVDSSRGITLIPGVFHDQDEPAGSLDPHIWLDFDNAKKIVNTITAALKNKDSTNADYYQKNADGYISKLTDLDNKFNAQFDYCKTHKIVYAGHYAFGYFAKRYGFTYVAAQGVSPDAEPTAKDLISLIDQIKKNKINYIFYEELSSPKIAETLSSETNAKILLLNAAHNVSKDDLEKGISFLDIMERNFANLKIGLECR